MNVLISRFAILGKKTVGTRIDHVPDVIVAGVCLYNFALDQGEDPLIQEDGGDDLDEDDDDDDDDDDLHGDGGGPERGLGDAAMLAQGEAHRQWLVANFCN